MKYRVTEVPEGQERLCLRLITIDTPPDAVRVYWDHHTFSFSFCQEVFSHCLEELCEKSVEELTQWLAARRFIFEGRKNFRKQYQGFGMQHDVKMLEAMLAAGLYDESLNSGRSLVQANSARVVRLLLNEGYDVEDGCAMDQCILSLAKNVEVAKELVAAGADFSLLNSAWNIKAPPSVVLFYIKECPGELFFFFFSLFFSDLQFENRI